MAFMDTQLSLGPLTLGFWDIVLIVMVSLQATVLAYMYDAKWKAFILTLPIPFTVATLSVGRPIDVTNVLGLTVMFLFTQAVRLLYTKAKVPIVPAIIISALGYCLIGWHLALVVPREGAFFWGTCGATLLLSVYLMRALPHRDEPGHRTPLPLYLKLPLITGVIISIVLMKQMLHGFMTVFPMVGLIGAYEARNSLWTMGRQIPVIMLTMTPFMMLCAITEKHIGIIPSLALGWVLFLIVIGPLTRLRWAADAARAAHDKAENDNAANEARTFLPTSTANAT